MIRTLLAVALAVGLLWSAAGPATAQDTNPAGISPQTQKINELIAKGWTEAPKGGIKEPAKKATDEEFLRRAFIDLIGRIPTPEEVLDFSGDKSPNKRGKLVARLLNESKYTPKNPATNKPYTTVSGLRSPEINYNDSYAENFAELWATWMLTRSGTHDLYRTQFKVWLVDQFKSNPKSESEFKNGKPWDRIVQDLIAAKGRGNDNGAVIFTIRHLGDPIFNDEARKAGDKLDLAKDGKFDAVPITSRVTKLFLGIKTQCVQCHDHPFNKEYIQSDFWGVNAFYRQTDRSATTNPNARNLAKDVTPPQLTLTDNGNWNSGGMVLYERRDGQRKASFAVMLKDIAQAANGETSTKRLVSGDTPSGMEGKSRREVLAKWIVEHDNFSRTFVNRMWGHLFGRGLNKEPSVDDFSSNNEVLHPELLNFLAEEFKKYNYDPKKLLEWICTSDAYQLSHVANKAYADPAFDPYFARMPLKAMSPEVMFDSLAIATRAEVRKNEVDYKRLKAAWGARLTQNFGDDEGNEITFNGTVIQALLMMNGKDLNDEIGNGKSKDNVVADVVAKFGSGGPSAIYTELFLMTVSRKPTKEEIDRLEKVRGGVVVNTGGTPPKNPPKGGTTPKGSTGAPPTIAIVPGAAANDVAFYQDVFWALLNSSEFMLNH